MADDPSFEIPESLQAEYIASIPEKMLHLQSLVGSVKTNPSPENLKALHFYAHKLTGSLYMYGYEKAGELCRQLSQDIAEVLKKQEILDPSPYMSAIQQELTKHLLLFKITSRRATIGVIGLGYIGLSLLGEFGRKGFSLVGYDHDLARIDQLKRGEAYYNFLPMNSLFSWIQEGKFRPSFDPSILQEADIIIISVCTAFDSHHQPNFSSLHQAFETLSQYNKTGNLIILQSTTYPGTTRQDLLKVLHRSKLEVGKDFFLAYVPEISDPGNTQYVFAEIPRIVGGITPCCLDLAQKLYQVIDCRTVACSSPEVAESAKILQNTYRLVNISLVNEMKIMFDRMGINIWEVIEAAKTKPFGFTPFYPSPGVGGDCIPVVSVYLSWAAQETNGPTSLMDQARTINSSMPYYVISKVEQILNMHQKSLSGASVLLLGVSYKKDINDIRESASLALFSLLEQKQARVSYHDPHVPQVSFPKNSPKTVSSITLTSEMISLYDVVLIAVDHSSYDWDQIAQNSRLIVDTRNVMAHIAAAEGKTIKA